MRYLNRLQKAVRENNSLLCVGLDPDLERLPQPIRESSMSDPEKVLRFCLDVIECTEQHCAAYKPNLGFFEALGPEGMTVFRKVVEAVPARKMVIADAKRGDIDSTARHYRKAFFEVYKTDAVTLNPLMGFDTLAPFTDDPERGVYALALTSNPGSADLLMKPLGDFRSAAEFIAFRLKEMSETSRTAIGMVIGATHAEAARPVLEAYPDAPLLIPGIGSQGGDVESLTDLLDGHRGIPLVNSSRSILYAGEGGDWQTAAAEKARQTATMLSPILEKTRTRLS